MTALYVEETYVDATSHRILGGDGVQESRYEADEVGDLFRSCQQEFGRCTGSMFFEFADDRPDRRIGWVFVKRVPFDDDASQSYLREVWVTVHDAPPTVEVKRTHHFAEALAS